MGKTTYSYIESIEKVLTNSSPNLRIIYLESDNPDILETVLKEETGSDTLRIMLGMRNTTGLEDAISQGICTSFLSVYKKDGDNLGTITVTEKEKVKFTSESDESAKFIPKLSVKLTNKAKPIVAIGPNNESFRFDIRMTNDDAVEETTLGRDKVYFFVGDNTYQLTIHSCKLTEDKRPRFYYIKNADALGSDTLEKMLASFLENRSKLHPEAKLILTGSSYRIPDAFAGQVQLIRLSSPTRDDIVLDLEDKVNGNQNKYGKLITFSPEELDRFADTLHGLTYLQLQSVYASLGDNMADILKSTPYKLSDLVWDQRKLESQKDDTLVYEKIDDNPGIVGIGNFSQWLNENLPDLVYPEKAQAYGLTPPRGVILSGVPGTGKSQLAKQLAYQWGNYDKEKCRNVSFITFNIGRLSSKWHGESEQKMNRFLERISAQEPAVLFIDEIEKTFHRDKPGKDGMSEIKLQQMGSLLGWLQEHKENIFTYITSNDISALPPELIRSGRLSARFSVFMPSYVELMCMLYSFLQKDVDKKDLFEDKFRNEIKKACGIIDIHNRKYGCVYAKEDIAEIKRDLDDLGKYGLKLTFQGKKKYDEPTSNEALDKILSQEITAGELSKVLLDLIKYSINPEEYEHKRNEKEKVGDDEWVKWMSDNEISKRTPFMTGADMADLIKNAKLYLRRKKPSRQWTASDFADAMRACCCKPDFTPYGQSNMDNLVSMYLNCDYPDVSSHPVLPRQSFNVQKGRFERNKDDKYSKYIKGTKPDNLYDQYLQITLVKEIEDAASKERQKKAHEERMAAFQDEQITRQRMQWEKEDKINK